MTRNTCASSSAHPWHRVLYAIGRHGRHGPGRHAGWPGGFGADDGPSFGRKLSSDELQLVLLALLAERPAHGYELIRLLEERSGGFYKPSSGMVYPALTYLDEIGHARATTEGNRKLYAITEDGRHELASHHGEADAILAALARVGARMGAVRDAFKEMHRDDESPLRAARDALRQALIRAEGCSQDEARRIAEILRRAAGEITGSGEGRS